ncbi:unnamed protein product, partial [Meganyctiphanes norvegica]
QVRQALVLSAPPPSLVLDGAGRAGDSCVQGGGEISSVLLSLPRPFQVIQHVLRRATPQSLETQVQEFSSKIDPEQPGAVVLCISGEILITPAGPALRLAGAANAAPTNVLLGALIEALSAAPTLVVLLDVVSVRLDESVKSLPLPQTHILPPLLHPNMAVIAGISKEKLQVTGARCSPFSVAVAGEVLHGVTLMQLHQRVGQTLQRRPAYTPNAAPADLEERKQDPPMLATNMVHEWLF